MPEVQTWTCPEQKFRVTLAISPASAGQSGQYPTAGGAG